MFEDHPVLHDYLMLNTDESISTVEDLSRYYLSGRYRPLNNTDDVLLITTLMIILNTKRAGLTPTGRQKYLNVAQLPFFTKVVKDIKTYITKVHHFDHNFIEIGFLFCKEVMPYVDHDLMQALIKRTVQCFDKLTPYQISYSCINSFLLHDKDQSKRALKVDLFTRLEDYIIAKQNTMIEDKQVNRKCAQQFLISLSATKLGGQTSWRVVENLLLKTLEKEQQAIK